MRESDDDLYLSEMAREIFKQFGQGSFEYYHIRNKIPGYNTGLHRKLSACNYIEVVRLSRHARIWKATSKTVKMVEKTCKH